MADIVKKLKLKPGTDVLAIQAPGDLDRILSPLPEGVTITEKVNGSYPFVMLFVRNKAELEREISGALASLRKEGLIWICYPKGSSGIQTDLTRDKGWESLDASAMQWLSMISLSDTWSAFCLRNAPGKKQAARASEKYHHTKDEWSDSGTKTVKMPDDFKDALEKEDLLRSFEAMSFSHRKEYVLWIVSAVQQKTRENRVRKAVEMLRNGVKTPR